MKNIKVIGFDADDTLWHNENFYQDTEREFCALFSHLMPPEKLAAEIYKCEMGNMERYGFGAKAFTLSLVETAALVDPKLASATLLKVIALGKKLIDSPLVLIDGVEPALAELAGRYRLVVITKGDLLDQRRKLERSGLEKYFHHVEIVSDKTAACYAELAGRLGVAAREFIMVAIRLSPTFCPRSRPAVSACTCPFTLPGSTSRPATRVSTRVGFCGWRGWPSLRKRFSLSSQTEKSRAFCAGPFHAKHDAGCLVFNGGFLRFNQFHHFEVILGLTRAVKVVPSVEQFGRCHCQLF